MEVIETPQEAIDLEDVEVEDLGADLEADNPDFYTAHGEALDEQLLHLSYFRYRDCVRELSNILIDLNEINLKGSVPDGEFIEDSIARASELCIYIREELNGYHTFLQYHPEAAKAFDEQEVENLISTVARLHKVIQERHKEQYIRDKDRIISEEENDHVRSYLNAAGKALKEAENKNKTVKFGPVSSTPAPNKRSQAPRSQT